MPTDLLGFESSETEEALSYPRREPLVLTAATPRGKHYVEPRGYAALPGTGPEGKQCRHCAHYTHASGVAGSYPKCGANRAKWTGGRGSDILAKAPACSKFTPTPEGGG
jgi:hypothetical protein